MLRTTLTGLTPALDAALASLPATALERAATVLAANTKDGYGSALAGLDTWLADRSLDDTLLAAYLAHLVDQGCSRTAASEIVAAARLRARIAGTECPAGPATSYVLAGLGRRQPRGIGWKDLAPAVPRIEGDRLTGARDAAIIVLGTDVDLSPSEVIALDVEDLAIGQDASGVLTIRRSQSDPEGEDATAILGEATVRRVCGWLKEADIQAGPMFRRMRSPRAASDKRMTERGIRLLATSRGHDAGVPGGRSCRSRWDSGDANRPQNDQKEETTIVRKNGNEMRLKTASWSSVRLQPRPSNLDLLAKFARVRPWSLDLVGWHRFLQLVRSY